MEPAAAGHALEVVAVRGPVLVQDGGRPGWMHHGVPPGGAWVPSLLARANGAVDNRADAAALECFAQCTLRAAGGDVVLAVDDRRIAVRAGETVVVPPPEAYRMRYVAVRGGVAVPEQLGGRGTLLVAALGGFRGRPLRAGDVVPVGALPLAGAASPPTAPDLGAAIRVLPGPEPERFARGAFESLLASEFSVSPQSDRVGTRLRGPLLARAAHDAGLSGPMVAGAIEVPASGEPIVLGPDHPTTGGYPVLAVVRHADLGALFARRPGAPVRFARG